MKLATFLDPSSGMPRAGAVILAEGRMLDLQKAAVLVGGQAAPAMSSVLDLIEAGPAAFDLASELIRQAPDDALLGLASLTLRAPIQPPPQIRDTSSFEQHLRQCYAAGRRHRASRAADPEAALTAMNTDDEEAVIKALHRQPLYYKGNRFSVIGHEQDVVWPSYSKALDFELEFGCYIGKPTKDVSAGDARGSIFGYTIYNDISARDAQALEMRGTLGPAKGKDFDTGNIMGPWLVTADEIPDPYKLEMIARVNGEEWGRGNSSSMHWSFEELIAHISQSETIYPGEFIGSGTVGNGCGLEQLRYLNPGDVVELEVEALGVLRNRITKA
ncbi:MAG: isomerase [Alphaproteobacteria bacterium]|uniref:fumarylacetoacetate hydrolase family protein n=1 Tax=Brevundimonas sp. BAL3 TaxID=391600 RepID=UPI00017EB741|nr:fumarylacetoacetate hydrolase family protein [Brevundimonas sp. BAL3]EDX79921.1 fumarylacetoacetate hydrolase family protein, putative [Brevundimonas sp. BAL3]PZO09088.1 MAG: isomerase [Alphaproteobacteria bacterium]